MQIALYQIDAFSRKQFGGNPAAVCPLESWLDDATLQAIAAENNLAETAFIVKNNAGYHLRWFTPEVEMDLCGHATLASAWVVFEFLQPKLTSINFDTLSGRLVVSRNEDLLNMDFPSRAPELLPKSSQLYNQICEALGQKPRSLLMSRDIVALFDSAEDVLAISPNMTKLSAIKEGFAVIATAPGDIITTDEINADFVSRFFAPKAGIPEDPVTGSAHSTLIPYWSDKLSKESLIARQLSRRGGVLYCRNNSDRVMISGNCVLYLRGEISLPFL